MVCKPVCPHVLHSSLLLASCPCDSRDERAIQSVESVLDGICLCSELAAMASHVTG